MSRRPEIQHQTIFYDQEASFFVLGCIDLLGKDFIQALWYCSKTGIFDVLQLYTLSQVWTSTSCVAAQEQVLESQLE